MSNRDGPALREAAGASFWQYRACRPVNPALAVNLARAGIFLERKIMNIQIKSRFDERVLYQCEAESLLEALQKAVKTRANLDGASLDRAILIGAILIGANLDGASLDRAILIGAKINWNSHALIAEILRREVGENLEKRCLAGCILISTDWCWQKFLSLDHPQKQWAIGVLLPWIKEGDNAPKELLALKNKQI